MENFGCYSHKLECYNEKVEESVAWMDVDSYFSFKIDKFNIPFHLNCELLYKK